MDNVKRIKVGSEFYSKLLECVDDIKIKYPHQASTKSFEGEVSSEYLFKLIKEKAIVDVASNKYLYNFSHEYNLKLIRFLIEHYPNSSIIPSGNFIYPVNGFMGWHTNCDFPCKRVYITVVDEEGKSGFKYLNDKKVVKDVDDEKIIVREFEVKKDPPFWHSVYSSTNRYSFGFRIEAL
jgi:hypothetical protein